MSHDTDKLIRQLSLVAFLMAERRPLTARDVKTNVEGYSEMSDEAFARRFYSDRAELLGLGVPLQSHRDEFTGEELYTLRSEQYFLPRLELTDAELAALQTALALLDGRFAYAEPLRLALQNLALGRGGLQPRSTETSLRVEVSDPDYTPEMQGRLSKLENAISKQRTVRFTYWTIGRDEERERVLNPYALYQDNGAWYVVGLELGLQAERTFRVSRIRGEIRFATRRERDFRMPAEFDVERYRGRPPWQIGDLAGEARLEVGGDTAWWVERLYGRSGTVEDGVFSTEYASIPLLASWVLRQDGRAIPLEPDELRRETAASLARVREAHEGDPPSLAKARPRERDPAAEREPPPVAPERFGLLQALLAYLLDRCGEGSEAEIPADELVERFSIPHEHLQEHLSLLNLVNFGGGCYAVYAELTGDVVRVDKELYGDAFRASPRLTPLEARAVRLALEFVGPMVAAEAHEPLEKVRRKLEETFGQFELRQTPEPETDRPEEHLVLTLREAMERRLVVEIEYLKEGEETRYERRVEPYQFERELPVWRVHTFDRTVGEPRTYRLDRMRDARLTDESFEPREAFDPEPFRAVQTARVWYSPAIARWKEERLNATRLADGSAVAELRVGSADWLASEILADRGDAIVIEPPALRRHVAKRARALARELRLGRIRVSA